MATIVYLDADDEITSVASRIRVADEKRIALVVPYGSRLATSRINFRLLAREAQARGRRLSVVAADAATRALAASAGLPVFRSVSEYEEAETARPRSEPEDAGPASVATESPGRRRRPAASASASAGASAAATAETAGAGAGAPQGSRPDAEETQVIALPAAGRSRRRAAASGSTAVGVGAGSAAVAGTAAGSRAFSSGGRPAWPYGQAAGIAAAALIGLAVLALAVGAYLLLPSASATVTLQMERIGPLPMEIRADPEAAAPDAERGVIPAQRLTFDVAASGLFPATGRRVEASRARGQVRFLSKNPVDVNNVGVGAIVSTASGVRFRTTARIVIPTARIDGFTLIPGEATVAVEAVDPGPAGNVAAQTITVVPTNEDPEFTLVSNPEPTTGGSRREFPRVEQVDVDAALEQLRVGLDAEFATILADPARVPPGLTIFGGTRQLVEPLPTTDPATLVGQEVAEFPLGLASTGTVMAVDPRPLESVVARRIASSVVAGYRLVDGSVQVTPGEPIVTGETVSFPVSATASQIRVLDPAALRDEIKGKPLDEARAILGRYGEVDLTVWPDWVTAIPTLDSRVDVLVLLPTGVEPDASPGPSVSVDPSSASPSVTASPASPAPSVDPGLGGESPPP